MFRRARVRLTILYIGLTVLALGVFSLVFYGGFATVLAPTVDLDADLTNEQVAEAAYLATRERIGLALLLADILVVVLVAIAAWRVAGRTLAPIRDAHARQRRFVADASHEMRNPLAAIRSSAEGALAGAQTPEALRRALEVNAGAAERLTRIANDLLLLARSGEVVAEPHEPVDLSVVVAETVERFAAAHPELPRARLSLAADVRVSADPAEIGRIVENLLDNAIRYGSAATAEAPRITTTGVDRLAVLQVIDQGPGIAAADLEQIFEPFRRVHAEAGAPEGSGLGLAIARSLAERNGGRLTATSSPGSGATFQLSLPRFT
ncbi:MAG TPA: HAMP domain-containing sensor histidine kinase [Candidatus Limnocylindrales bacterium]|nr:HAMP domain-containing sensor histidine kinase [Candidatus Limnocylindrales bacterium]